ncbi:type 2 isopentenyl-diphosphate Delta-isomerase [Bacillus horti]|uniref:Isopentenyl-diphosphate delta-isomerase n=1 Tax=Caldalkalibacillus horti TaxID=77523 RepID=A0ABT9VXR9_9BACI|nr:type 2 isopentenyl-diphosphate Delta-isomerase [Bacillus horti]MDQ0165789.1 isopentenyl-diphosphate delta-isomerase [Bacillus horti]
MNHSEDKQSKLPTTTEKRKNEHIEVCLQEDVQGVGITNGFERYRFIHNALPEIDFEDIQTATTFLSKTMPVPFLISSMTGGTQLAWEINQRIAQAAEERGWAMGLGSMRAALENPEAEFSFKIRKYAPSIPVFANIGAVQFNYGYGVEQCLRAVDMIEADTLVLHLNSMQEVFQPEGDKNFKQLLNKMEKVIHSLPIPVGVKEVGWGISADSAKRLKEIGVQYIDVAGAGGTSWSQVEKYRTKDALYREMAETFAGWGNPTAECVKEIKQQQAELLCIASGGINNGLEAAKAIALGAHMVGYGRSLLQSSVDSVEQLAERLTKIELELKIAMFGVGAADLSELKGTKHLKSI